MNLLHHSLVFYFAHSFLYPRFGLHFVPTKSKLKINPNIVKPGSSYGRNDHADRCAEKKPTG